MQLLNLLVLLARWIGAILIASGTGMAWYIVHQAKQLSKEQKEHSATNERHLTEMMDHLALSTQSQEKTSAAIDRNTDVIERLLVRQEKNGKK